MKKLTVLFLALLTVISLTFGLAACKTKTNDTSVPASDASIQTSGEGQDISASQDDVTSASDSATTSTDDSSGSSIIPEEQPPENVDINGDGQISVLFLGNSLMFFNDMPIIFENMAKAAGKNVFVRSVTQGSATITKFADPTSDIGDQTYKYLNGMIQWDYLILEPSRRTTPYENTVHDSEIAAAKVLSEKAAEYGTKTLLYSVWGYNHGNMTVYKVQDGYNMVSIGSKRVERSAHAKYLHDFNVDVSSAIGGARITRTGLAFENFLEDYDDVNLYASDNAHPSLEGSFLAAATIYATVFNEKSALSGYNQNSDKTQYVLSADRLCKIADETVLDRRTPDLTFVPEDAPDADAYKLLIVGSDLMTNNSVAEVFGELWQAAEGRAVYSEYVKSSSFTFHDLLDENTDHGLRFRLSEIKWDAIVLQITRRLTISSTNVRASEFMALRAIVPLLKENTENVCLFTLNGASNPTIFTVGADGSYVSTGTKESCSAAESTAYFATLATQWAEDLGLKKALYGSAYIDFAGSGEVLGYMQACALYNAFTGKGVPAECDYYNGVDTSIASRARAIVEKYCIDQKDDDVEGRDYNMLVLGSAFMNNYNLYSIFGSLQYAIDEKVSDVTRVTSGSFTFNDLIEGGSLRGQLDTALSAKKYDAVVMQITRRCTPNVAAIEAKELAALREIMPLIKANCENVFFFTLDGSANPTKFKVNEEGTYSTDGNDNCTAAECTQYFANLAKAWSEEFGVGAIYYGSLYLEYTAGGITPSSDEIGYLRACAIYDAVMAKTVPADCTEYCSLSEQVALTIRALAEKGTTYPEPEQVGSYNVLVLGSSYMNNHDMYTQLGAVKYAADGVAVDVTRVTSDSFTFNDLKEGGTLREKLETALSAKEYDAVVMQITRRCTPNSAAVEASELAALEVVMPTIKGNCENVFFFILDGNANPTKFKVNESGTYSSDGKDTCTAIECTQYYANLAKAWSEKFGVGAIYYGSAFVQYGLDGNTIAGNETGYMRACAVYNAVTGKKLSADCKEYCSIEEQKALSLRAYAEKAGEYFVITEPQPQEPDDPEEPGEKTDYNILVLGSDLMSNYSMETALGAIVTEQKKLTVNVRYVKSNDTVINNFATDGDDLRNAMLEALNTTEWDAVIIQISRRMTKSASDVEASERAALASILPTIRENTDNIYLFYLTSAADPTIFTTEGGAVGYTSTGNKEDYASQTTATEKDGVQVGIKYFDDVARSWAAEFGIKYIPYGRAYNNYGSISKSDAHAYLRAITVYQMIFGEAAPNNTTGAGSTSSSGATKLRTAANNACTEALAYLSTLETEDENEGNE